MHKNLLMSIYALASLYTSHSCYSDAWKSTVYNVKTVSTDISANIHRKCPIFGKIVLYLLIIGILGLNWDRRLPIGIDPKFVPSQTPTNHPY